MQKERNFRGGFALPTVLIASVVMLTVLAVSVSSVTAIRTALKVQYYEQLAKVAGEAGVAYAKACLAKNSNVPLWTDAKPLTPATDCAGNDLLGPAVQLLVVGGGGGGGGGIGGGGGGGGVVQDDAYPIAVGSISVYVGAGGAGGTGTGAGGTGSNSSFAANLARGGGGGGARINSTTFAPAGNGASGGGGTGTYSSGTGAGAPGGTTMYGQGNNGGMGSAASSGLYAGNGGGGGGAGAAGGNATGEASGEGISGVGGNGIYSDISGQQIYYGAGGSGGRWGSGDVGIAGLTGGGMGGSGSSTKGADGHDNTGGGGGGGSSGAGAGGAGGSGVVVVRYANNGSVTATGGLEYVDGPYVVHRFNGNSTFNVTAVSSSDCPTDPRCSVTVDDNLRSSFKIGAVTVDDDGRAVAIPNTGYVELLRSSNGSVWRTYRQPAVQVAAVPDFCSDRADTDGFGYAMLSSVPLTLPNAPAAQAITSYQNGGITPAGESAYRKDFTVLVSGTYTLSIHSSSVTNTAQAWVDGAPVVTSQGSLATADVTLTAGCHGIAVLMTNDVAIPQRAFFSAAIHKSDSSLVVATDNTWYGGDDGTMHFSRSDYLAGPMGWGAVTLPVDNAAKLATSSWSTTQDDKFTQMISPPGNGCPTACPADSTAYLRDDEVFIIPTSQQVTFSAYCTDDCRVFLDGTAIINSSQAPSITQHTMTVTGGGRHQVGIRVYNSGSSPSESTVALSVVAADGTVLTRTDASWTGSTEWKDGFDVTASDIVSFDPYSTPLFNGITRPPTFDYLIVGGGGGGGANAAGGGGAGGVITRFNATPTVGTYTVTVGAGGAGAVGNTAAASKGGNTTFGSNIALGGGGGTSRDGGIAATVGGSGGAGAGATSTTRVPGAAGTAGQGFAGGDGSGNLGTSSVGGGGGGAGGPGIIGISAKPGDGGPGVISYITGARLGVGGGGGGSTTVNGTEGLATNGGGYGLTSLNGVVNTGGGGGARRGSSPGGNGGSGLVIIRVKTGSMNVSTTGSPAVSTISVGSIGYTVYRYTSSGSFRIISFN